jgi:hypothetical protein
MVQLSDIFNRSDYQMVTKMADHLNTRQICLVFEQSAIFLAFDNQTQKVAGK